MTEWPSTLLFSYPHGVAKRLTVYLCQDFFVEIDVVMDASTPLQKAHDIAQLLQDKIEVLPNVERAFVHVDHETDHTPVRTMFTVPRLLFLMILQEHRK